MNKKNYFLLFLFFLGSFLVRAQSITVQSSDMPTSVVACGDQATFAFNVFGPLAAGAEITATLPAGSSYASLVSGNVTVTVVSATQVKFKLNNALAGASNTIKVEYKVETACSGLSSGVKVKYETGAVVREVDYPSVEYSQLEVTGVTPTSATIAVNATQNYTVTVSQSAATYSNNVKILITHSAKVALTAPVGTLTLGTPSAGSQTDVLELTGAQIAAIGDGDTRFENGETITAVVAAKLITCTSGESLGFKVAYGCGTTTHCATGNTTNVGLAQTATGTPVFLGTVIKNSYPGWFGQPDTGLVKIENTGNGDMYNVEYRLYKNYYANLASNYAYYKFSSANVNGVATPNVTSLANQYYYTMQFTTDPDGAGVGLEDLDGDGFYDDLAAGKSFQFGYTETFDKDASPNVYRDCISTDGMELVSTRGHLYYDNACAVRTFGFNVTGADYNIILSTYSTPLNSDIKKSDGSAPNLSLGDTFNFTVNSYNIYQAYSRSKNMGASQAFWRLTFRNVPAGVEPNGNGTLTNAATGSWVYNAAASNPAGGILVYDSTIDNINSRLTTIPLKIGSACITNGSFTMDYDFTLYQDTANKIRTVFCNTTPSFTLNCAPVTGIELDNFTFRRTNLGYTDNTMTTQYTEATAPATLERTRFTPGDNAQANFTAVVNNAVTNPVFVFEYNANITKLDNDKVFDPLEKKAAEGTEATGSGFRTGTFSINRGGTLYNFTINDTYYIYTQNNGATLPKTLHRFDVNAIITAMKTANVIPASFTLQVGDVLNLVADYKVAEGLIAGNSGGATRNLGNFKAYVESVMGGSPIVSNEFAEKPILFLTWNSYDDSKKYNTSETVFVGSTSPNGCNEFSIASYNYFLMVDTSNINFYPNEYRPFAKDKKISLLLPSGFEPKRYEYDSYGGEFALQANPTPMVVSRGYDVNGNVNPNGGYNLIEITDDGSLKYETSGFNATLIVKSFYFKPKPIMPSQLLTLGGGYYYNFTVNSSVEIYANSPENKRIVNESTNILRGYSFAGGYANLPKSSLSSSSLNVTTATNQADFSVSINNNSINNIAIQNAWLSIEVPNNNLVPTLWDGATQIPLTSYGTGKYVAQLGTIAFATAKNLTIKSNSFSICGTDSFVVKTGWDCDYVPVANGGKLVYAEYDNEEAYPSDTQTFSLTTQNPAITSSSSVNSSGTQKFDVCNPIDETLTVTNGANGYAYEIYPEITLPVGMSFVSGSFKVNYNGTDYTMSNPTLISGTTYRADIYSAAGLPFAITGLPGSSQTTLPISFSIKYQVSTLCTASGTGNYVSGSRINYVVKAESGCGVALPLVEGVTIIRSNTIDLNGSPTGKTYSNKLESLETNKAEANFHVNDAEKLQVEVINQGDPTGALESIKIFVDQNVNYVAGSVVNAAGTVAVAEPISNTVDASGQRVLEWEVPTPFVSGETIRFTFDVKLVDPSVANCSTNNIMSMNTYVGSAATCAANGEVCNLQFPTGATQEVTLKGFAPTIDAVINSSVFGSSAGNTTYNISYTITNQNTTYVVKPQLTIKIYNDVNGDGLLDAGDTLLDTKTTVGSVAASGTLAETITGSYLGSPSKLLLSYESNNTVSNICTPVVKAINAYCYKPAAATGGSVLDTKHGITALGRAGTTDADNWPMVRKGAWTVLEAKTKGFVINRIATTAAVNAIPNPIEGMMVYDEEADCLKIYIIDTAIPANTGWKCFNTQACPD